MVQHHKAQKHTGARVLSKAFIEQEIAYLENKVPLLDLDVI